MTGMSPLLQNSLGLRTPNQDKKQNLDNRHEKIYQDLQKRAHEAKPNEAKAVMVKEGILGNPITDTVDFFKDGANFAKAVKNGNMGDNNLGRINDFGLKIGAAIIATFLAAHSKTKKDTIMRFFGGAMFIAAMDLWPKLFINLPARLVHGFRIDRKYISAQGDKKDFFLDNQFLVWDAYPEEQLRKDAKNAGIDYDSENGKEKIQRKMQKTALQNRALWMATAGFATPLMTAMTCNFVEPYIEKAIVAHDVKKVGKILASEKGLENYFKTATQKAKVSKDELKAIDKLFEAYQNGKMTTEEMIDALSDKFSLAKLFESFKDSDDINPLANYKPLNLKTTLIDLYEANRATLNKQNIITIINTNLASLNQEALSSSEANEILRKLGKNYSKENVEEVLSQYLNKEDFEGIFDNLPIDMKKFQEQVKKYYSTSFTQLKARTKAYLDLINPLVGSKAESFQTLEFNRTMKETLKALGIDNKTIKEATKSLKGKTNEEVSSGLTSKIIKAISEKIAGLTGKNYQEAIAKLPTQGFGDEINTLIENLVKEGNINLINRVSDVEGMDAKALTNAILGISNNIKQTTNAGNKDGLVTIFRKFIDYKLVDIEAIKAKSIICANFERRLKDGDLKGILDEDQIEIARKILYDGTTSTAKNKGYAFIPADHMKILDLIFDKKQFEIEKTALEGKMNIEEVLDNLKAIFSNNAKSTPTKQYFACGSFTQHIKKFATSMGNNKAWMKIFAPMSIALVAVTLLVQPLFGKIDKEFQEEGKGGAK